MYTVAMLINDKEEYMRELCGDDCFTDDLGEALTYDFQKEIPPLREGEYIVAIEVDEDGCLYIEPETIAICSTSCIHWELCNEEGEWSCFNKVEGNTKRVKCETHIDNNKAAKLSKKDISDMIRIMKEGNI
ncbi:MAG TPA: hypothetical protein VIK72_13380 [Clostridiaceae bacterium]